MEKVMGHDDIKRRALWATIRKHAQSGFQTFKGEKKSNLI